MPSEARRRPLQRVWGEGLPGVEPTFTTLNGQDPVAFILSCNVARRHLSKGQQAMAVARAREVTPKVSLRETAEGIGLNRERVRKAALVLDHAPELANAVLSGDLALNDAYEQARQAKLAAEVLREEAAAVPEELDFCADSAQKSPGRPKGSNEPGSLRDVSERINVPVKTIHDAKRHAETAAEVLREEAAAMPDEREFQAESAQKSVGGRPPTPDSERKVSERIGVPQKTLNDAKRHAETADGSERDSTKARLPATVADTQAFAHDPTGARGTGRVLSEVRQSARFSS